jgi:hypothetical protein
LKEAIVDQQIQQYRQGNAASRQQLHQLVARLSDDDLTRPLNDDWTVAATLVHLAFWDQSCVARWEEFDRNGSFVGLSGAVVELINTASLPAWLAIPGLTAVALVLEAAEEADRRTEQLSDAALTYVVEHDRAFILDRASHRTSHLDEIEQVLNG